MSMEEWRAILHQARAAGFVSTEAIWRQAMHALRARVLFGGPVERYEPATRARLEAVLAETDRYN